MATPIILIHYIVYSTNYSRNKLNELIHEYKCIIDNQTNTEFKNKIQHYIVLQPSDETGGFSVLVDCINPEITNESQYAKITNTLIKLRDIQSDYFNKLMDLDDERL